MMRAMWVGHRKVAAVAGCLAAVLSGCNGNGKSSATTAPAPAITADSLIVSIEDVRQISETNELSSAATADLHRPSHHDSDAPAPCRAAYDQEILFGNDWTQFRSVTYSALKSAIPGGPNKGLAITQGIGLYPDAGAARTAYDRLFAAVRECSPLHRKGYNFTVSGLDPSTVELTYPDREQSTILYRVKSTVFVELTVQGFAQSERIATTLLQTITDRMG